MYEGTWREHHGFLVEHVPRRQRGALRRKTDGLRESRVNCVNQERALVPGLKRWTAEIDVVDFDAFLDILSNVFKERLFALNLIKGGVNQIYAEDADRLLLEDVGGIPHINVQEQVVWLAARLHLKSQSNPAVRLVGSRKIAGGDRVDEAEEASPRSTRLGQLVQQLSPFALNHGHKPFPGDVTGTGTVQVITDFFVIRGDGFGDGAGSTADDQKPSHDFLASANFGERAESSRVHVDLKSLLMSVEVVHGCQVGRPEFPPES